MPVTPTYPGVYIEEVPSGVRTITGVATAITAFIGRALRGPVDEPTRVQNFGDYDRAFGGLWLDSTMSYAVRHFFQNGGTDAIIVRCFRRLADGKDGIATAILQTGTAAQGTLILLSNPVAGDTMTIGAKTYTFDAAPVSNVDGHVQIGATLAQTQANIIAAINLSGEAGNHYAASMTRHPGVRAAAPAAGNDVALTAQTAGAAGNALATTSTFTPATSAFDAPTLGTTRSGVDAVAAQGTLTLDTNPSDNDKMTIDGRVYTLEAALTPGDGHVAIGATLAATRDNIRDAINRTGAAGVQYANEMVLHPTVGAAPNWVGNNLVLTAKAPGAAGNAIVTTTTLTAQTNRFGAATLTGGAIGTDHLVLEAATAISGTSQQSPGAWGNNLRVTIDLDVKPNSKPATDPNAQAKLFNIEIREIDPSLPPTAPPRKSEKFHNVSTDAKSDQHINLVLQSRSFLARVGQTQTKRPIAVKDAAFGGGNDGLELQDAQISHPGLESRKEGLWASEKADLFNLLCIPPLTFHQDIDSSTREAAKTYCGARRAFYILDAPNGWTGVAAARAGVDALNLRDKNVAVYFPRVWMADPLRDNQLVEYAPCGVVAGLYARTDARRGVWKAPAGTEATMTGVRRPSVQLTEGENGQLNPLGINCLRSFHVIGNVVWGSRTLDGADQLASEWKYVPVRRTALYIEETLYRALQWVVFEPNDEPLWAQIRLNVGSFMHTLFRQGAFQGSTPKDAYLVKCDSETTPQADIDRGIVNILVGFAPLKPAEFVFVRIQQLAGQLQT